MIKIVILSIIFGIIIILLKGVNQEIAMLSLIVASIIILLFTLQMLGDVLGVFESIYKLGGIDSNSLKIVIKITTLCYLVEFSVSLIENFGLKSLADKVTLAGKLVIFITASPIILKLIEFIQSLL